jgi:hypothetical protein
MKRILLGVTLVFFLSACTESRDSFFTDVALDEFNNISWVVTDRNDSTSYFVEELRFEKWEMIGEVLGKGIGENAYSFNVDMNCAVYQLRVSTATGKLIHSDVVENDIPPLDFSPKKVDKYINFTNKVNYEVIDQYGNLALSGCDKKINTANLKKGMYYLLYGDKSAEFLKKEINYLVIVQ